MTKAIVNMFGKEGHSLSNEPFLVDIIELRNGKDNHICLEEGDRFEIVEVKE